VFFDLIFAIQRLAPALKLFSVNQIPWPVCFSVAGSALVVTSQPCHDILG
jgi:hypothetical protein